MEPISIVVGLGGGVGGTIAVLRLVGAGCGYYIDNTIRKYLDTFVDKIANGKDPLIESFFERAVNARITHFVKEVLNSRYPMKAEVNEQFRKIDEQIRDLPRRIADESDFRRAVRSEVRHVMEEFTDAKEVQ